MKKENVSKLVISGVVVAVVVVFGGLFSVVKANNSFLETVAKWTGFYVSEKIDLGEEVLGTGFTMNTSNSKFTESSDLYQNVQALVERMSGLTQDQVLQVNSAGSMEVVSGITSLTSAGSIAAFTTNASTTAAQFCDSPTWTVTPTVANAQLTLPTTSTLFADCLGSDGIFRDIAIWNAGTVSTTQIFIGTGGTLGTTSSSIIYAADGATLRITRDSATTYKALLTNFVN